jgi:hypothetical protein
MENAVATAVGPSRFGIVAAPLHTVVVLALLAVGDYLGAIRSGQLREAASVDRVALYGRTIFLELLMLGIVLLGVWLHGVPFASVLGERWRSAREVLRDVGIALAFWVVSTSSSSRPRHAGRFHIGGTPARWWHGPRGAISIAAEGRGKYLVGCIVDHGGNLRGGRVSRLFAAAVHGVDQERSGGNFAAGFSV